MPLSRLPVRRKGTRGVSDFIVRATIREVKRLQRKHNDGKAWAPLMAGALRCGQRISDEMKHRIEDA